LIIWRCPGRPQLNALHQGKPRLGSFSLACGWAGMELHAFRMNDRMEKSPASARAGFSGKQEDTGS